MYVFNSEGECLGAINEPFNPGDSGEWYFETNKESVERYLSEVSGGGLVEASPLWIEDKEAGQGVWAGIV